MIRKKVLSDVCQRVSGQRNPGEIAVLKVRSRISWILIEVETGSHVYKYSYGNDDDERSE